LGRKLTYSMSSQSKSTDGGNNDMGSTGSWQITVVRENPDGSRRLILRSGSAITQNFNGQKHSDPERVSLAYADVFPDGRVLPNDSLGMHVDLSNVMPPLPADEQQLSKGWSKEDARRMQTMRYTQEKSSGDEFVFRAVQDGVMNKIYVTTSTTTYHFHPKRGIITANEGEQSQDYGFHSKGTGSMKLESDETLPADKAKQVAADFATFFAAQEQYQAKMSAVETDAAHADELIAAAEALLTKARDSVTSGDVTHELNELIKHHEQYAKYAKDDAGRFDAILNKPAPDWETSDIDGHPAKLADYRGTVVVMDFWYRGCGWCMYAMPQVKQVAEDFSGKPVIVLGMNTDREEKDARLVIDTLGLKYPTIKAEGIPQKYGVQGFPTLIVIDQDGIVRKVHVGYSPTLRDDIGKKIRELLEKPAATAKPAT
jgi:thiol-disulfide isomerase/thioredoxin